MEVVPERIDVRAAIVRAQTWETDAGATPAFVRAMQTVFFDNPAAYTADERHALWRVVSNAYPHRQWVPVFDASGGLAITMRVLGAWETLGDTFARNVLGWLGEIALHVPICERLTDADVGGAAVLAQFVARVNDFSMAQRVLELVEKMALRAKCTRAMVPSVSTAIVAMLVLERLGGMPGYNQRADVFGPGSANRSIVACLLNMSLTREVRPGLAPALSAISACVLRPGERGLGIHSPMAAKCVRFLLEDATNARSVVDGVDTIVFNGISSLMNPNVYGIETQRQAFLAVSALVQTANKQPDVWVSCAHNDVLFAIAEMAMLAIAQCQEHGLVLAAMNLVAGMMCIPAVAGIARRVHNLAGTQDSMQKLAFAAGYQCGVNVGRCDACTNAATHAVRIITRACSVFGSDPPVINQEAISLFAAAGVTGTLGTLVYSNALDASVLTAVFECARFITGIPAYIFLFGEHRHIGVFNSAVHAIHVLQDRGTVRHAAGFIANVVMSDPRFFLHHVVIQHEYDASILYDMARVSFSPDVETRQSAFRLLDCVSGNDDGFFVSQVMDTEYVADGSTFDDFYAKHMLALLRGIDPKAPDVVRIARAKDGADVYAHRWVVAAHAPILLEFGDVGTTKAKSMREDDDDAGLADEWNSNTWESALELMYACCDWKYANVRDRSEVEDLLEGVGVTNETDPPFSPQKLYDWLVDNSARNETNHAGGFVVLTGGGAGARVALPRSLLSARSEWFRVRFNGIWRDAETVSRLPSSAASGVAIGSKRSAGEMADGAGGAKEIYTLDDIAKDDLLGFVSYVAGVGIVAEEGVLLLAHYFQMWSLVADIQRNWLADMTDDGFSEEDVRSLLVLAHDLDLAVLELACHYTLLRTHKPYHESMDPQIIEVAELYAINWDAHLWSDDADDDEDNYTLLIAADVPRTAAV